MSKVAEKVRLIEKEKISWHIETIREHVWVVTQKTPETFPDREFGVQDKLILGGRLIQSFLLTPPLRLALPFLVLRDLWLFTALQAMS